jgi:tRNA (cmo5U34)-methyltransferase
MNDQSKHWDKLEGNREYFDNADIFIQDRRTLLWILQSFYKQFILPKNRRKVLDLGTGDGILLQTLHHIDSKMEAVAADGSEEILDKARAGLAGISNVTFAAITFEEIIAGRFDQKDFDLVVSSLAIHHLLLPQKRELFLKIFKLIAAGGWFINIDTVTSGNNDYDAWYLDLWHDWIVKFQEDNKTGTQFEEVAYKAPKKPENHYDKLNAQLHRAYAKKTRMKEGGVR